MSADETSPSSNHEESRDTAEGNNRPVQETSSDLRAERNYIVATLIGGILALLGTHTSSTPELNKSKAVIAETVVKLEPKLRSSDEKDRAFGYGLISALGHADIAERILATSLIETKITIFRLPNRCGEYASTIARRLGISLASITENGKPSDFEEVKGIMVKYFHSKDRHYAFDIATVISGTHPIKVDKISEKEKTLEIWIPKECGKNSPEIRRNGS